jgi:mannose-6-phosphate isomerase-like protein (cupin superfamily)
MLAAMTSPEEHTQALRTAKAFDIASARNRLAAEAGGYEVVHRSAGLELGVYVLVVPEPDKQQPHEDDEVYVVLEGRGTLEVGDEKVELREGHAVFRANHGNLHVRGYKEEGTTTTPFDMVMLNDLDRFHLVMDVLDRVPGLSESCGRLRQELSDRRIRARAYTREHGDDDPKIRDWVWPY